METNSYVPEIYIGENGNWFINGSDTGQPSRGPQGKSAYEIAVTFGYRGTEAEWLAGLKGEQGSKGDKGDKGDSGDRGIKGDKGDKGDSGEKGVKGDIGDTGDKGAKGDKGDKGDSGDKGVKGDSGAVGPQGIQGPKGDKGDIDAINDQTPTYAEASSLIQLSSGEKVSVAFGKIAKVVSTLINHVASSANESVMGHVKISRSASITETGTYALDAVEKNVDVPGTLANQIAEQNKNLINKIYPIGSIYMSVNNVSPATFSGGTWEPLKDRFLLGAGNSYGVNSTGGAAVHTLTMHEVPNHNHGLRHGYRDSSFGASGIANGIVMTQSIADSTMWTADNGGGGQPHNNMPPYLAVYIWKRIA